MDALRDELNVFLNEVPIGVLIQNGAAMNFHYTAEYLTQSSAYPLAQILPLKEMLFAGAEVENFFSNLLPDERMRLVIARVLGTAPENTFGLLKRIGEDCAGAVSFYAPGNSPQSRTQPVYRELSEAEARDILENLEIYPLGAGEPGVRISGAGSQAKLVACVKAGKIFLPLYGTPSTHIVKPAIPLYPDSVYNEYFCMKLAKLCKIPVAECEILKIADEDYYVVERFDRVTQNGVTSRLHQEDFCQVLNVPPQLKYQEDGGPGVEACMEQMTKMLFPAAERMNFLRLVLFNFLIGNCDAHAKNYAVLYRNGRPAFAPAYDLLSTMVYELPRRFAMSVGGENRMGQISRENFEELAKRCQLHPKLVLDELSELCTAIPEKAKTLAAELNSRYPSAVYSRIVWEINALCRQVR